MSISFAVLCPFGLDAGLLTKAVALAGEATVRALVPKRDARQAAAFGAGQIHTLPEDFSGADEAAFALWLAEKIKVWGSTVVLAPATVQLRGIMPLLAARLNAGLTADCTALAMDGDQLIQTRPAFGNSLMADIRTVSSIQLATVRPGTFPAKKSPARDWALTPEKPLPDTRVKQLEFTPFPQGMPLSSATVIVAGGMGVGSQNGFKKLEQLARRLGGALAASRSAVDAGLAPYRCQVGLTGVSVCPRLYIAVGISGAVQHLSGMSGAQTVVAINSDPKAPIFDYADYGIVGDWEQVIDQVLEELL